jgi:hypothetical protein
MITIPNTTFTFIEPLRPGQTGNQAQWWFDGDKSKIVHIHPGCGCTADIQIHDNMITATYTETSVTAAGNNISAQEVEAGYKKFNKALSVYLDDGKPLKIKNGMSEKWNPDKLRIVINLAGSVDLRTFKDRFDPTPKKIIKS